MANKYRVDISYRKFVFDDRKKAIDFAETAFNSREDKELSVEIKIIEVTEKQEGEDNE